MKKLILCFIIVLVICLSSISCFGETINYNCSDWARDEVHKASLAGIVPRSIFDELDKNITRLEFCELILSTYTALGYDESDYASAPFTDCKEITVKQAYNAGLVKGVSETLFAPDDFISREQMAVVMGRLVKITETKTSSADISSFGDVSDIASWALEDVKLMVGAEVLKGNDGNMLLPKDTTSREQAVLLVWRLYRFLGGRDELLVSETTVEILSELGIIDEDKLFSAENVTYRDFFTAIDKARGSYTEEIGDLSDWYRGDTLAELDDLEDSEKALLLRMYPSVLSYDEIARINMDEYITESKALQYLLRALTVYNLVSGNSAVPDTAEIYRKASYIGLIQTENAECADVLLTYKDLGVMLHKALFAEFKATNTLNIGIRRLYGNLMYIKELAEKEIPKAEKSFTEIPINATLNGDLAIVWEIPEEYGFIAENRYFTNVDFITESGKTIGEWLSGATRTKIDAYEIIRTVVKHRETKFSLIRCTYSKVGVDTEYWFDIDISNIKTVESDEEIKPGKYVRYKKSWYAREISLCEPYVFEKGCYYVLNGYENTYRKDEYNHISHECFMAEETGSVFASPVPVKRSFGVSRLDDIHIIKVTVNGNPLDGFVLTVSKESTDAFEVEESEMSVPY